MGWRYGHAHQINLSFDPGLLHVRSNAIFD